MIAEDGVPLFYSWRLATNVDVLRLRITEILQIKRAVGIQFLGIFHTDGIALTTSRYEGNPTSDVLMKIVDVVSQLVGLWSQRCHLHSWCHLGTQSAKRNLCALSRLPSLVVVASHVPTRQILAGVVFLTIVLIVGTNGTISCYLPFLIRRDTLHGTVSKLDEDIDAAFGQSEDGGFVGLVLAHGEHAAITQNKTYGILLL